MRKVEFGAGIAAAALSVLALAMLLFAPLVSYCDARVRAFAACPDVRYTSLAHAGLDAFAWMFLVGMLLFTLVGAAGAISEAHFDVRAGAYVTWAGAVLVFAGCALTASGIGLLYLPSVLALCLAAYASVVQRIRMRMRQAAMPSPPPASTPAAQVDPKPGS